MTENLHIPQTHANESTRPTLAIILPSATRRPCGADEELLIKSESGDEDSGHASSETIAATATIAAGMDQQQQPPIVFDSHLRSMPSTVICPTYATVGADYKPFEMNHEQLFQNFTATNDATTFRAALPPVSVFDTRFRS